MIPSLLASLLALTAAAQLGALGPAPDPLGPDGPRAAATYDGSARQLRVDAPLVADPDIEIDGRIDAAEWAGAALLTGFTQFDPVEGSAPSEPTEVRVVVGGEAIYFAVRAEDRGGAVRATLTERDGYGRSDDFVRVILDTFDDGRRAFVFMVNPHGVQGDGLWVEGSGGRGDPIDWSPDFLWESAGRIDEDGYSVEMRIPLKSLRFPAAESQDWGLQIQRTIRRTGYQQSWAPITSERANRLAQSGSLEGLRNLDPGLFLEVNPTLVGSRQGSWDQAADRFSHAPAVGELGLNLTYGLTSNLTLDGTVNPDFSQVEADAGQIAVNERFALFLREQRPFFLEGADVFSMPERLVYTRSIVNPIGAAKVSGKVGSFSVAYVGAVDEVAGGASQPIVNLLRVKHDVGRSSTIGMVYTDRTEPGASSNRVLGGDARLVLGGRYTLELLAAASADGVAGEAVEWGSLVSASIDRAGRNLSMSASFEDVASDFRARSGFIRRTGVSRLEGRTGYTFRGERGALVESWGPSLQGQAYWDRDTFWAGGRPLETEVELGLRASFRGNVGGFVNVKRSSYDFGPEYYGDFASGPAEDALAPWTSGPGLFSGLHSVSLRSWISTWERVRGSIGAGWAETPIFVRGVPVDLGRSWNADLGLTVYPTGAMQAEVGVRHVAIFRDRDGSRYSSATIPRVQARYQLSRALYVRGIGEYASQERGPILDGSAGRPVYACGAEECSALSGSDTHDVRVEGLLGYELSPGTVFFLGYTREFRDTSAFGFERVRPTADGLFLKASYRFRL